MRYASVENTSIITDDGTCIPADPENRHYAAIVASGAKILPFEPEPAAQQPPSTPPPLSPIPHIALTFRGAPFGHPDTAKLGIAVNLANAAIANGAQAGDVTWMDGQTFSWPAFDGTPLPMDAPTVLEFAAAVYATI